MAKKTALYDEHLKLGANVIEFAGWDLPVYYSRLIEEHNATREKAGLFDIGHMGEFRLTGKGAFDFLQHTLSRDFSKLVPGFAMYSTMLYEDGGTVDDLFVYRLEDEAFMIVVNAANARKDWNWMQKHSEGFDVQFEDISDNTSKIDLQGPLTKKIMQGLIDGGELPARFHFAKGVVAGVEALVSRTGYTGEDGVELYCAHTDAPKLWRAIIEVGKPEGLLPCGLGARDSLRIECCYSLYGHELLDNISPVEAGISFVIGKNKDFVGGEAVKAQLKDGAPRMLIGFELAGRGVPREHYDVQKDGGKIGEVTSGTFSPTLNKGLGMALVKTGSTAIGDTISVIIRDRPYDAVVVKKPFLSFRGGDS